MQLAEPRFVVPCKKAMMSVIDRKYTALKRTVRGAMIGQHSVTLTTDIWTSRSGEGYFSLTAHYVTSGFEMKHSSLQCHHMAGTHNHSNLSGAISDSLGEWCIDVDKDVTAFNGSNVVKAVEEDLDKVHLPCAGHTLNLSVQKAFEVQAVQKAISRSKNWGTWKQTGNVGASQAQTDTGNNRTGILHMFIYVSVLYSNHMHLPPNTHRTMSY